MSMAFAVLEHLLGQPGNYMKAINIYHKSNKAFTVITGVLLEMPLLRQPCGWELMEMGGRGDGN